MPETRLSKRTINANGQGSTKRVEYFQYFEESEEFEEFEEFETSDESEEFEESEELEEPTAKRRQLRINSKTPSSSRALPGNGQNSVPRRSRRIETQVRHINYPVCGRLDFKLKEYVDQNGKERLFMGVVPHGRLHSNMITPVQGFNAGIYMGICPLRSTTTLDAAVSMAGLYSEHRLSSHMPHVFFMVAPIAKHPNGEEGTLSSNYDRIFLSSSQQHINIPPKNSDMERLIRERDQVIQERDKAIQERDQAIQERDQVIQERDQSNQERDQSNHERNQAIQERNSFNKVVQTGNPYNCHNLVELVGRYASSESHALLCKGFMKKWEDDSLECRDRLEKATDLSARHAIIKASLDDIYQLSQEFDAQAEWMTARHTSRPL